MRVVAFASLIVCMSSALGAQGRLDAPAGVVRRPLVAATETALHSWNIPPDSVHRMRFVPRALLGTGGAVVGIFAGAGLGITILGRDCGGCDDPGLGQALTGAAFGAVIAGAAISAIPQLGSRCSYAGRFGRALIGSTVGGILGGVASGGSAAILATFPLGIGTGAALAANTC